MTGGGPDRESFPAGRLWRFFAFASAGIFAAVLAVVLAVIVGGFVAWVLLRSEVPPADPAKARVEVQRYYDARFPRRVEVVKCDYVEADSVFDSFSCRIKVQCQRALTFSVPRAGAMFRSDDDPFPQDSRRPRCAV